MSGKSQIPYLSRFPCFSRRFMCAAVRKEPSGVFQSDVLVKLPQVKLIDFESLQ